MKPSLAVQVIKLRGDTSLSYVYTIGIDDLSAHTSIASTTVLCTVENHTVKYTDLGSAHVELRLGETTVGVAKVAPGEWTTGQLLVRTLEGPLFTEIAPFAREYVNFLALVAEYLDVPPMGGKLKALRTALRVLNPAAVQGRSDDAKAVWQMMYPMAVAFVNELHDAIVAAIREQLAKEVQNV